MVHQYQNNGYNIVLDVNSGAIHVVDELMYAVIGLYEEHTPQQIIEKLRDTFEEADVLEALDEIEQLKKDELLFTPDEYEDYIEYKETPDGLRIANQSYESIINNSYNLTKNTFWDF